MGSLQRLCALIRLAAMRIKGRVTSGNSRQLLSSIFGVAIAVMLMTTVGGVAIGLASQSAIQGDDVDYWIVPEANTASSIAVSVDGPQLGGTHNAAARLSSDSRIDYATPVLLRVVKMSVSGSNTSEYVIAAGVIPAEESREILGVPTGSLTPGDPHYENGSYNGAWTGEIAASDAAASLLNASAGDEVTTPRQQPNQRLRIVNVSSGGYTTGGGPLPVVLLHQSELQSMTGATNGDPADQILVSTNDPSVQTYIENVYPGTNVVQKSGVSGEELSTSSLPVAIGLTAVLAAVVIGTLFVATMMGLELHADRKQLAVLAAMGYRERSRAFLVIAETFLLTFTGAALGVVLGLGGIELANNLAEQYLGVGSIAVFDPLLIGAAGVVAVLIAAFASIYPVWLTRHSEILEVLG